MNKKKSKKYNKLDSDVITLVIAQIVADRIFEDIILPKLKETLSQNAGTNANSHLSKALVNRKYSQQIDTVGGTACPDRTSYDTVMAVHEAIKNRVGKK